MPRTKKVNAAHSFQGRRPDIRICCLTRSELASAIYKLSNTPNSPNSLDLRLSEASDRFHTCARHLSRGFECPQRLISALSPAPPNPESAGRPATARCVICAATSLGFAVMKVFLVGSCSTIDQAGNWVEHLDDIAPRSHRRLKQPCTKWRILGPGVRRRPPLPVESFGPTLVVVQRH